MRGQLTAHCLLAIFNFELDPRGSIVPTQGGGLTKQNGSRSLSQIPFLNPRGG